jgi:hypothetical protein
MPMWQGTGKDATQSEWDNQFDGSSCRIAAA